jgi:hypothetical protein
LKKKLLLIFGIGVSLIMFSSFTSAQFHELSFCGTHFSHAHDEYEHNRDLDGSMHQENSRGWMTAPVVFPDSASGMNVTRLSVSYRDNDATYGMIVRLYKTDRWTGQSHMVAELDSDDYSTSAAVQYMNLPKSQMQAYGIDNNRYAWFLYLYFNDPDGNTSVKLHQVTVRYE